MPEYIQDLDGVQAYGLGSPSGGGKSRQAEFGLASNLASLAETEVQARAQRKAAEMAANLEGFTGIVGEAGKGVSTAAENIRLEAESKGQRISQEEALDTVVNRLSQGATDTNMNFIREVTGRQNISQAEAEKFLGSAYFRGLANARQQGAKTDQAIKIAAEWQIKKLISANPAMADEIRKVAAREIGFDPTGEYNFMIGRREKKPEDLPKSEIEKRVENAQRAIQYKVQLGEIPPDKERDAIAAATRSVVDNWELEQKSERVKNLTSVGQYSYTQAANERLADFGQEVVPEVGRQILTMAAEGGLKVGADGVLDPAQQRAIQDSVSGIRAHKYAELQDLARRAGTPFDSAQANRDIEAALAPVQAMISSRDFGGTLKAYNELAQQKQLQLSQQHFGNIMVLKTAFGENYGDMLKWMSDTSAGAKWAKEMAIFEPTGAGSKEMQSKIGTIQQGLKDFEQSIGLSPLDRASGKAPHEATVTPAKAEVVKGFRAAMPVDDKQFAGVVSDSITQSADPSKPILERIRNGGALSDGQKQYLSEYESAVLSDTASEAQVISAIRWSVAMGTPGIAETPKILGQVDQIYIDDSGVLTVDYFDRQGNKRTKKDVWDKDYGGMYRMVSGLAGSGLGKDRTGVSSKGAAELRAAVNKKLANSLDAVRAKATLMD